MKNSFLILVLLLALSSCGNKKNDQKYAVKFPPPVAKTDEEADENMPAVQELEVADPGVKSQKGDPNADIEIAETDDARVLQHTSIGFSAPVVKPEAKDTVKKIIKQGDISFETHDVAVTRKALLADLKKFGGYLDEDDESMNSDSDRKEYTLKTRLPANNFDSFLTAVATKAIKIDSKHISITDVTTKYIDMATRLHNKKLLEKRYLDLLGKATVMQDILAIEGKLNEIQTDIESVQGQFNYLSKQIAYSSLDVTFYARHINKPNIVANTFGHRFYRAMNKGFGYLGRAFFGFISLWPVWAIVIAGFIWIRIRIKRRRAMASA